MFQEKLLALLLAAALTVALSGCSKQNTYPDETASTDITLSSYETTQNTDTTVSSTKESADDTTSSPEAGETSPVKNSAIPDTSVPVTDPSETAPSETKPPVTNPPVTKHPVNDTPSTEPPSVYIAASSAALNYSSYISVNEPSPYIKGEPLYGLIYKGSRIQLGDNITLTLTVLPKNHSDERIIEASDNLSYTISDSTITVTAKLKGEWGEGRISVYYRKDANSPLSAQTTFRFLIDDAGNPLDDPLSILPDYARSIGISYTPVRRGYTADDPSASITSFNGAPAWDDQILKSDPGWMDKCFWLIDRYKAAGYTKMNFIITEISIGFSANY